MTNKLALIVAVVLGVLSIMGIKAYVDKIKSEYTHRSQLIEVLVASHDVPEGEMFDDDDIETAQFPREILERALREDWITNRQTILGVRTRAKIKAGQVLLTSHFHEKKKGGLKFSKEERAVTIPIGRTPGLYGMLRPGDFVDIVGSLQLKDPTGKSVPVTRTLFKNVLILATDTNTDPFSPTAGLYTSLTFRLRPEECNKLLFAALQGGQLYCLLTQPGTTPRKGSDPIVSDILFDEIAGEIKKATAAARRAGR